MQKKFIFEMETVLTFVQQQDVHIKQIFSDEVVASYDSFFDRGSNGAPYAMYPDLQDEIIKKLYCKLIDNKEPCNQIKNGSVFNSEYNEEFRSLVYKVIEPFHMKKKFRSDLLFVFFWFRGFL